jgi:ketosteroid isomerase-like protein
VSQESVEGVRRGYQRLRETGQFPADTVQPDFVFDMSHYDGWTEQPIYAGPEGAQRFLDDWTSVWDAWEMEIEELHDVGDKVLAIVHQRGRSKRSGMLVEGSMGHLWTLRDGKGTRMDMYSDPSEALKAVGLEQ